MEPLDSVSFPITKKLTTPDEKITPKFINREENYFNISLQIKSNSRFKCSLHLAIHMIASTVSLQ